jgi:hypothetical protein
MRQISKLDASNHGQEKDPSHEEKRKYWLEHET